MSQKRVKLYERLPEIYRIRDAEQSTPDQLKSYIALVEEIFGFIHENIESLYHDLFIETCDEWVVHYIGDLLGTTHLTGDPWTLRADVADTIPLRRRKGTLVAIERLAYDLTEWGVHCVELRENLLWNQHLNHQRPDRGGEPPYSSPSASIQTVTIGGTVTLRDPAMLSLCGTPFDPFSYTPDLKYPSFGKTTYNLPNLAIFLWRLKDYQIQVSKPVVEASKNSAAVDPQAKGIARVSVHPLGEPVRLFNTHRFRTAQTPPILTAIDTVTEVDATPNAILPARLTTGSPGSNPSEYVAVENYDETDTSLNSILIKDVGLQIFLPQSEFAGRAWSFRGANLCAWEKGLQPPLKLWEIAIDPVIGRMAVGVRNDSDVQALLDHLLLNYTYGAVGPVGAHPVTRPPPPKNWEGEPASYTKVNYHVKPSALEDALGNLQNSDIPIVIEIQDSMAHELDLRNVTGVFSENNAPSLALKKSLVIQAGDEQRPVIKLSKPLRFRPTKVKGATQEEQKTLDALISNLTVHLEGLYLTRGPTFPQGEPLIARAAVNSIELFNCTLDPGNHRKPDDTRAPTQLAMRLEKSYEFADPNEGAKFNRIPEVHLQNSVTGPLFIDDGYTLYLTDSILDAGSGISADPAKASYALSGSSADPANSWGAPIPQVNGVTVFGRMRVRSINGRGGIWAHPLEVLDNQHGCIKFSYFCGHGDRLPQNHGCVSGDEAELRFTEEVFGEPAYAQLAHDSDFRIRERGPSDDAMGAFGPLLEAHKWHNIQIRFREFMPVDVKPLVIAVT